MNWTAPDYFLFALDLIGAGLALQLTLRRHRSIWPLWAFLGWWIAADLAQLVAHFFSLHAYALAYYSSALPKFALEFVLAAWLCGVMVKERPEAARAVAMALSFTAGVFIAWQHHSLQLVVPSILKTEIACCGALGLVLILGWIGSVELLNREVGKPWRGIIVGTILLIAVQALGFGLQARFGLRYWDIIARIRPVGELMVLGIWSWATLGRMPALVRRELLPRFPVVSVMAREQSRMVQ